MKKFVTCFSGLLLASILVFPSAIVGQTNETKTDGLQIIDSSSIVEELREKKRKSPRISPRELAAFGNRLLAQKGFHYRFDVCEFLQKNGTRLGFEKDRDGNEPFFKPFAISLTTLDGGRQRFRLLANEGESPCGECFTEIPALQVTAKVMTVLVEGKPVRLRRPKDFMLDEIALVDKSFKKVIRRWQAPFQGGPDGISADGTKIYYLFSIAGDEEAADEVPVLALELSDDGRLQLRARNELNLGEGQLLKNFPRDKQNDYLQYRRFRRGANAFIIRYSEVCT